MEYGYIHFKVLDLQVIAGATLFMGAVVYAVARRNDRAGVFAILWFLVALLPHSNLFPINAYLAEHWLYLPSIGFFVLVARPLARAVRGRFRALAVGALALLVVAYSLLTVRQNGYWHDPLVFYARTLSYTPHSDRVAYNLGLAYLMRGQNEKAVVYFRRALALTPTHKEAHNNLGLALLNLGRVPEAIGSFEAAVKSDPSYADAYSNLGTAYMRTRHMEKALESLQNAIRYKPGLANAHANLGSLYHSLGRDAEACWSFERALERDPRNANMWNDLGIVYETMGDAAKASASYRKALAIDPAHRGAQENIRRLVR